MRQPSRAYLLVLGRISQIPHDFAVGLDPSILGLVGLDPSILGLVSGSAGILGVVFGYPGTGLRAGLGAGSKWGLSGVLHGVREYPSRKST